METADGLCYERALRIQYGTGVSDDDVKHFTDNFNIIYFNIQSIRNKLHDLESVVKSFNFRIHAIVLTEIWIMECENKFFNLPGYTAYFSNRKNGYGGTALYIIDDISSSFVFEEEFENSSILCIKLLKQNFYIFSVYKAPDSNIDRFIDKLDNNILTIKNSIVVGDLNINLLQSRTSAVRNYIETITSNGFVLLNKQTIEYATRIANSVSVIDHIFTDLLKFKYKFLVLDTSLSDHQMLILSINIKPILAYKNEFKEVLNYESVCNSSFWSSLANYQCFNNLQKDLSNLIKSNIQKIPVHKTYKKDWMTPEIVENIKLRESFFKFKKKYPDSIRIIEKYKFYKQKVNILKAAAKKRYYSSKLQIAPTNSHHVWNIYKQIMYNKDSNTSDQIKVIEHNGVKIENDFAMAEMFNDFFVNITSNIDISTEDIDIAYLDQFSPNLVSPFTIDMCTSEEVNSIIQSLNPSASSGYDQISIKFIKKFSHKLSPVISNLINASYTNGVFPDSLKKAIVTPILKAGSSTNCNNYRPISVLNSLSKIFETSLKKSLRQFLVHNKIMHSKQYGFEVMSNTTAACLDLTDYISRNMDDGKFVATVFLDLKKAFDCVDFDILLHKLKLLGFDSTQMNLFATYLRNRTQAVRINGKISNYRKIIKGVPQGSILGPDLFKIYINDIAKLNLYGKIQLFADDTAINYSGNTQGDLMREMQQDLGMLEQFFDKHRLLLNVTKTKILLYENRNFNNFEVFFKGEKIENVKTYNYLGLIVDSKLNFHDHIDRTASKIIPYVFILKRLKLFLDEKALYTIYCAHIMSHIHYVNPIWSRTSEYKLDKINKIQKKAIKIILGLPRLHPTNMLYTPKYISFVNICKIELFTLAYKIINNLIKHHFTLSKSLDIHNHNTRNKSNFYLSVFKSNRMKSNCLYNCLKEFNELPVQLKESENLNCFVKMIRGYVTDLS